MPQIDKHTHSFYQNKNGYYISCYIDYNKTDSKSALSVPWRVSNKCNGAVKSRVIPWRQARSYHYAKKPGLAHYFVKISLNEANYAPYRAYDNVILWKN